MSTPRRAAFVAERIPHRAGAVPLAGNRGERRNVLEAGVDGDPAGGKSLTLLGRRRAVRPQAEERRLASFAPSIRYIRIHRAAADIERARRRTIQLSGECVVTLIPVRRCWSSAQILQNRQLRGSNGVENHLRQIVGTFVRDRRVPMCERPPLKNCRELVYCDSQRQCPDIGVPGSVACCANILLKGVWRACQRRQ